MSQIEVLEIDSRLAGLISPFGGVISGLERLGAGLTRAPDTVTLARLGEVGALRDPSSASHFGVELDGIGCHIDPGVSARIAVMEALERYAAAAGDARRWVTGSAVDMGGDGLDVSNVAQCSVSERAAQGFPLATWDPSQPIRWARGWSLLTGRDVWVPAVMSHLGVTPAHPTERFWLQTSSGCAAGETQEEALLAACFELIERDAVAISWLQRLSLRRLDPADPSSCPGWQVRGDGTGSGWDSVMSTLEADEDRDRIALFDATSDIGVPTVLAVLMAPAASGLQPAVGAGCCDSGSRAALKALRELTVVRACLWGDTAAGPAQLPLVPQEAFAHLLAPAREPGGQRRAAGLASGALGPGVGGELTGTVERRLARIVAILAGESSDVVAVELTPVELDGSGVRVVRVIAPALIPFLAHPNVRYLASRRLYEAPRRMGCRVLPEGEVNPWPSPLW